MDCWERHSAIAVDGLSGYVKTMTGHSSGFAARDLEMCVTVSLGDKEQAAECLLEVICSPSSCPSAVMHSQLLCSVPAARFHPWGMWSYRNWRKQALAHAASDPRASSLLSESGKQAKASLLAWR